MKGTKYISKRQQDLERQKLESKLPPERKRCTSCGRKVALNEGLCMSCY